MQTLYVTVSHPFSLAGVINDTVLNFGFRVLFVSIWRFNSLLCVDLVS